MCGSSVGVVGRPSPDNLGCRSAIRPGLYLGRAYMARAFALNFTLLNEDLERRQREAFLDDGRIEEDCRVGGQRRIASN